MRQPSKSKVRSAVSAIIEKEQREQTLSPFHVNERNRLWVRRNLRKHLKPVLSEMGLDKDKAFQVLKRHRADVESYLQKQEKKSAKRGAAVACRDRHAHDPRSARLV